jgi:hypothetical protein
MLRQIPLLVLLIACSATAFAQAKFQFKEETHNFGEVPEGPNAVHIFEFENVGNEPLIITQAKAGCNCTVPQWPKEPILPGESGKITVSYTTKGRIGSINKTVTISSNAEPAQTYLRIKGTVLAGTDGTPVKEESLPSSGTQ